MKKFTFAIALSVMLVFLLIFSGCGNISEKVDVTVDNDVTAEVKTDYEKLLNEKVSEYEDFINNYDENSEVPDGFNGVAEVIKANDNGKSLIGYLIDDINGDFIPELYVGSLTDKQIYAVWCIDDGEAKLAFEGWARNSLYYVGNSEFFNQGSGGAANSISALYKLNKKTAKLTIQKMMFTDCDENGNMLFYSSDRDDMDKEYANKITEYEYNTFVSDYELKKTQLDLVPFSLIGDDTEKNISSESAVVKGEIADEDVIESNCEYYVADESENSVYVKLNTDVKVNDFKFLSVAIVSDGDEIKYNTEVLHSFGSVSADTPIVIKMTFYGDIPTYAFSYEDGDGTQKRFLLGLSGEDGSLIMNEFK